MPELQDLAELHQLIAEYSRDKAYEYRGKAPELADLLDDSAEDAEQAAARYLARRAWVRYHIGYQYTNEQIDNAKIEVSPDKSIIIVTMPRRLVVDSIRDVWFRIGEKWHKVAD